MSASSGSWHALAARGSAASLFGLAAVLLPRSTATVGIVFFGAFAVLDGVLALVAGLTTVAGRRRRARVAGGLLGIGCGGFALAAPSLALASVAVLVAVWCLGSGVVEIVAALRLHDDTRGEILLALAGVASLAVGLIAAWLPAATVVTLTMLFGAYSILFGGLLLTLAYRTRRLEHAGWTSPSHVSV